MGNKIAHAARGWIGTRFHHQGRLKKSQNHKGGVDCLGLLIGVANELELPYSKYDENDYSHYPDTNKLKKILAAAMQEIQVIDITSGDILLLNIDGNPQHLAIVGQISNKFTIIHAYAPARCVVEHIIDDWWHTRIVAAYRAI
jgi:hypothetical protein